VASSLHSLASLLRDQGDFSSAEQLYTEAQTIWQDALGPRHPSLSFSYLDLAILLREQEHYQEAERVSRQGLMIRQETLPQNHWLTASAQSELGRCLVDLERYQEAESLILQSYPIIKDALIPGHPRIRDTVQYTIELYDKWGKTDRASEYSSLLRGLETHQREEGRENHGPVSE